VNLEIEQFIALHGSDRIFPLIMDGTPGSGDEHECFPPALRSGQLEPIAGDLRKEGDGPRAGLLKVISGILQVPFDELLGREAQQRQRRLAAVLAVITTIAISTTLLAVYAMQQRDVAKHQQQIAEQRREQAEDLIGFMLGDLRERLQSLGRLDVLDAVGNKVKGYFEELPISELTDQTLASQAKVLGQIGEIRIQQGNYEAAKAAFELSIAQATELHRRHPNDTSFLFDLSQAQFWQGYSHTLAQEFSAAETLYLSYLDSARTMVQIEPENSEFLMELAYAYSNLGMVRLDLHDKKKSLEAFQECRTLFEDLYRRSPDDLDLRFEIAATDGWLARVHSSSYDLESALKYRLTAASELGTIAGITEHPFHIQNHAEALGLLADLYFRLGNTVSAVQENSKATEIFRQLSLHDENNLEWQMRYIFYQYLSVWLGYFDSETPTVQTDLLAHQQRYEKLSSTDPENGEWQAKLAEMKTSSATVALLRQDEAAARNLIESEEFGAFFLDIDVRSKNTATELEQLLTEGLNVALSSYIWGDREAALEIAQQTIDLAGEQTTVINQHLEVFTLLYRLKSESKKVSELESQLFRGGFKSPRYLALVNLLSTTD
jgi:tetratricopeptide (TPR) repeat protein